MSFLTEHFVYTVLTGDTWQAFCSQCDREIVVKDRGENFFISACNQHYYEETGSPLLGGEAAC